MMSRLNIVNHSYLDALNSLNIVKQTLTICSTEEEQVTSAGGEEEEV